MTSAGGTAEDQPRAAATGDGGGGWPGMVSVVVPVRNGGALLGEQLAALDGQDYDGDWELIVSDNGSTDDTLAVVASWQERMPRLRLVDSSASPGAAPARNEAAAVAKGRFLAFCDADDVVTPSWLRELVAGSRPGAVVGGSFDEETLNDRLVGSWLYWNGAVEGEGLPRHLGFLPFARGANFGADAEVWAELGGNNPMVTAEDVDFCWRAQLAGHELLYVPAAVVRYRLRPDIRSTMRQGFSYGRADTALFARYRPHGLRSPSLKRVARAYAALTFRAPQALLTAGWRGRWCRAAAYRAGRARGSLERRVWYP
jgi:glycosyltransferase involved in cell wall biosynthesis